jgi:hypothetical protein
MSPSISPASLAARVDTQTRHGRVVSVLCEAFPKEISASNLMVRAGLPFHNDPVTAFTQLCISISHINSKLPDRVGWKVDRTGGTPGAFYRLSPVADGGGDAA